MRKILLLFSILFFITFLACTGSSTSQSPITSEPVAGVSSGDQLATLEKSSKYICHARITKVSSRYERYDIQSALVMSRITLDILENWKGNLIPGTEIRSFGGIIDGIPYEISDGPSVLFQENEEVVLFLNDFPGGIFPVLGQSGKYPVTNGVVGSTGDSLEKFSEKIKALIQ
ncbi:MAG: hypothetical protein HY877_06610 [Deltaproteobacteria bacterium]|nr:hypothetical protein [Deltaproteobacteria bacterium]